MGPKSLDGKITSDHELLVLKTARHFKFLIGEVYLMTDRLNWPLVPLVLLQHIMQITSGILLLTDATNTPSSMVPAGALARKMHCLVAPIGYTTLAISWWKTNMLIEIAEEVNEVLLTDQFPISSSLRAAIIADLENRHWVIIICVMSGAQLMVLFYFVPPVLRFLTSPSSSRQLHLPLNLPDPLSIIGFAPTDVSRAIVYFIVVLTYMSHFYIIYLGKTLTFVIMDSLKTAFFICGQSLQTFGHEGFLDTEQFLSVVKLHQRLFRLSSKVKNAVEPYFIVTLPAAICYNTTCALAITHQEFGVQNAKMIFGIVVSLAVISCLFILPGSTTHQAEDLANRIYFNENWLVRRLKCACHFPFMIMRSNKLVKFRIYNCWVVSEENFLKYLQLLYSIYIVLKSTIPSSTRETGPDAIVKVSS